MMGGLHIFPGGGDVPLSEMAAVGVVLELYPCEESIFVRNKHADPNLIIPAGPLKMYNS